MSELAPEAKRIFAAARDGLGPDRAAIARMQAGVIATVAAAPASAAAASSSAAAPIAAKATLTLKLIVAGAIATTAVATTTTIVFVGHRAPSPIAIPNPTPNPNPIPIPNPNPIPTPNPIPIPATAVRSPLPPPAIRSPLPPPAIRSPLPPPAIRAPLPSPAAANRSPALTRETELLDEADAAKDAGDLAGALAKLRLYDREIGAHGQLAEDAAAREVDLLCLLHDPTAAAALARFEQRWPHSAAHSGCSTNQ